LSDKAKGLSLKASVFVPGKASPMQAFVDKVYVDLLKGEHAPKHIARSKDAAAECLKKGKVDVKRTIVNPETFDASMVPAVASAMLQGFPGLKDAVENGRGYPKRDHVEGVVADVKASGWIADTPHPASLAEADIQQICITGCKFVGGNLTIHWHPRGKPKSNEEGKEK
jgi:hypothetical protein